MTTAPTTGALQRQRSGSLALSGEAREPAVEAGGRTGWGSATALGLLLGLVLPLLFGRPTLHSLAVEPVVLAYLVTLYSAARLGSLLLRGENRPISLTFWLFVYVWFGLAALANTVSQQFPLFGLTYDYDTEVHALVSIIVGIIGYEFGARVARLAGWRERSTRLLNRPTVRIRRVVVLGAFSVLIVGYFTLKLGVAARFSSRQTVTDAFIGGGKYVPVWLRANKTAGLLRISLDWVPVFLSVYLYVAHRRLRAERSRTGGRVGRRWEGWRLWLCAVGVAAMLANNPFTNPRYRFGGIAIALLLAMWPLFTARRFRVFSAALVFGLLFVYPYAAVFRYSQRVLQVAPLNEQFRTSADFSMFQQELNVQTYVRGNGHAFGRQIEGVALAWVPRKYWGGKPIDTGAVVLSKYVNVISASVSIWGSAYVDGGLPWVFVMLALLGWVGASLEHAYRRRPPDRLSFAGAAGPLFAAFQIFLIRGDLQPAFGELAPVGLLLLAMCSFQAPRGTVGSRSTGETAVA
jgi:hypothetical protein